MSDLSKYVGTWSGQTGDPAVTHALTWESDGIGGLTGRYVMQPPPLTTPTTAIDSNIPSRIELQVSEVVCEDEVLIFDLQHSPFPVEFRMVDDNEATFGAASHKLSAEFSADHRQAIEKHRVRLSRKNI